MLSQYSLHKLKAKNETSPRKNRDNVTNSVTPLTVASPSRNAHADLSGSDKENYPHEEKTACVTKVVQELQAQKKSIKFKYVYM
uniref:Uncharacterized protein n=1 Tax=Panagrolaimus sp. ES5 TaxID=591445 RepID=A0AC34FKS9_9BILA